MSSIHIRDVSESTLRALKVRARRHHRSLQKEIVKLLEDAAKMTPEENAVSKLNLKFVSTSKKDGSFRREEIYDGDR